VIFLVWPGPFVPLTLWHPASLRSSQCIHALAFAGVRLTHVLARRRLLANG
jgi:hypothetical protein